MNTHLQFTNMAKVSDIRSAPKFRQTVLLIDDQPTVLDIHSAILKSLKLNLKVVCMTDPVEALEWLKNKQVDLIITDYRMQHMDGMQFVQKVKDVDSIGSHQIIVVTAVQNRSTHQKLIAAGAAACLTKPVNASSLAQICKDLLVQSKHYYAKGLIN